MNFRIPFLSILLSVCLAATTLQAQNVNDLYREGMAAYNAGDWATAVQKLTPVVNKTGDPRATFMLKNARLKSAQPSSTLERRLSQLVVKELAFDEVSLGDAFEYLTHVSKELSEGKMTANIIYSGDASNLDNKTVTLELKNVPFTTVLEYVAELTSTQIKYETYAIKASPRGTVPVPEDDANEFARSIDPIQPSQNF